MLLNKVAVIFFAVLVLHLVSMTSGSLYSINRNDVVQVSLLDPKTTETKVLSHEVAWATTHSQLSTVDNKKNLYYVIVANTTETKLTSLFGFDLQSGKQVIDLELPVQYNVVQRGQTLSIDPSTGDVMITALEMTGTNYTLLRVTPTTGKIKTIATFQLGSSAGDSVGAYNPSEQIFYMQFSGANSFFMGIDAQTGNVVFTFRDVYSMQSIDYDPVSSSLIGVGYSSAVSHSRKLVRISNGKTAAYGDIGEYSIIVNKAGTIDFIQRVMYTMMARTPSPEKPMQVDLVSIDIDSGKIVNHVPMKQVPCSLSFGTA